MECAQLAAEGKSPEEIRLLVNAPALTAAPRPLTMGGIFWAVFFALWAFGISAGIVVAVIRSIAGSM